MSEINTVLTNNMDLNVDRWRTIMVQELKI